MQLLDDLLESVHNVAQLDAVGVEILQIRRRLLKSIVTVVSVDASLRF